MSELIERDRRLIEETLKRNRRHFAFQGIAEILIFVYICLDLRPLGTGFGKFQLAILVLGAIAFGFNVRALVRARKGGPLAIALLDQPAEVATVKGWPGAKFPEGQVPRHIRVVTRTGARGTLRVDENRMRPLIEVIRRRSPTTEIAVCNVAAITPGALAATPAAISMTRIAAPTAADRSAAPNVPMA